jgi:hypothetical protein
MFGGRSEAQAAHTVRLAAASRGARSEARIAARLAIDRHPRARATSGESGPTGFEAR